jgi:hypothetical protein
VQRRRQLPVGDRVRRRQVVRPAPPGPVEQEPDRPHLIGQRDPAHHLLTVTEAGQQAKARGQRQPGEHAAAGAEHQPAAQVNDADAGLAGRIGRRLPVMDNP